MDAIIFEVVVRESIRVNKEIINIIDPNETIYNMLTDSMLLLVRLSEGESVYKDSAVKYRYCHPNRPTRPTLSIRRSLNRWAWMLLPAIENDEMASDLDLDEIVSWLTLALDLLMIKIAVVQFDDLQLRRFIGRFIVEPILAGHNSQVSPERDRPSHEPDS